MTSHNPNADRSAPAEFAHPHDADLTPTLKRLLDGHTLTARETANAFEAMMTGRVHHGEMGALLALLATRPPTAEEILGAARIMREHVDRLESSVPPRDLTDTAGTGGAPKTWNVSTAAAIIAAGAGATVAKHGNKSRTGRGSAEVLRQLGVNVDAGRDTQRRCLEEAGVCFCFAIHHHPATRHVMPVRLALGFPTIFNLLGPLANPAGAQRQIMGVYDDVFVRPIAEALRELGAVRALVMHSRDGLDELSISAPTRVVRVDGGAGKNDGGALVEEEVDPAALGLELAPREAVTARDLEHAAAMVREVLAGTDQGPARSMALLNAAATLVAAGRADSIADGLALARTSIDRGDAAERLDLLARLSRED